MSLYLAPEAYDALRKLAFERRTKMHVLLRQAVDPLLKKHGAKEAPNAAPDGVARARRRTSEVVAEVNLENG
jgi:hypothetical protein